MRNAPWQRNSLHLLVSAGWYDQADFEAGPVGGVWLETGWDLNARMALLAGVGARTQLYDGSRELDPRLYLTLRGRP